MDPTDHLMGDTVSFSFDVADTEVMPESEVVSGEEDDGTGVISQLMDIREPLIKLRVMLEKKLDLDLSQFDFWLQDTQLLEETMTLVEQCVQGEGLVQINIELKGLDGSGVKKVS
jgi:GA-binding protein transcription factor alpha